MNNKRKYLKQKKRFVKACKYLEKCAKSGRKQWIKRKYNIYHDGTLQNLKVFNDKYYRIRADYRFVNKYKNCSDKFYFKAFKKSKAYYLRHVKR